MQTDWKGVREMVASGAVNLGGRFALDLLDERAQLAEDLEFVLNCEHSGKGCVCVGHENARATLKRNLPAMKEHSNG